MKKTIHISIPEPCHEDWAKMTPQKKGRFCQSCTKTVVDFTVMSTAEIEDYIHKNKDRRICGRIHHSQLKAINLKIPQSIFSEKLNFHRLFLLALLISMGLTLFNCEDDKGKIKKIDSIEVIVNTNDIIISDRCVPNDTTSKCKKVKDTVAINKSKTLNPPKPPVMGDIVEVVGIIEPPKPKNQFVFGMIEVEQPPEFINTPIHLSSKEKKDLFQERVNQFVSDNFDIGQGHLNLNGKQRILTQFIINRSGKVSDIKVRAPHPFYEEEAKRVLKLLPNFRPGKQSGKSVSVTYSLPITFMLQD